MTNYLIMKRDLYYRPQGAGYTGIKDHAGRYTLDEVALEFPNRDSAQQDGISFIPEEEAPDYTKACFQDLREAHQKEKLTQALDRVKMLEGLVRKSLQGWENILELGFVPVQHVETVRALINVNRQALKTVGK